MPIKPRPLQVPIHSQKCEIKKVEANLGRGPETRYLVSMSLTEGELSALDNCLSDNPFLPPDHKSYLSPVARDVGAYVKNARERAGILNDVEKAQKR